MDFLKHIKDKVEHLVDEAEETLGFEKHSHTHLGEACHDLHKHTSENRFHSFAPIRGGNDAKWFVDGCGYFWAVSVALEEAKESIWILDWWLSPELYLRRPPSNNPQYRLDKMLLAAAERGVKVNIIVYKEVASLLTCEYRFSLEIHLLIMYSMF
jgi:phospholipase D1/2